LPRIGIACSSPQKDTSKRGLISTMSAMAPAASQSPFRSEMAA
jgi:hypothetical protein